MDLIASKHGLRLVSTTGIRTKLKTIAEAKFLRSIRVIDAFSSYINWNRMLRNIIDMQANRQQSHRAAKDRGSYLISFD